MRRAVSVMGCIVFLAGIGCASSSIAQTQGQTDAAFVLTQQPIDVGLVVSDLRKASEFYGDGLGLQSVAVPTDMFTVKSAGFAAGASTIFLHELSATPPRLEPGVMAVNGMRLLTILVKGSDTVAKRLATKGFQAPQFAPAAPGAETYKLAFVTDPDGNTIELVAFDGDVGPGGLTGFQVGLTVSDAQRMRDFHSKTLGLPERPALQLPDSIAANTMQYMFRAANTTLKFWAPATTRTDAPSPIDDALGIRYLSTTTRDLGIARRELGNRDVQFVQAPTLFGSSEQRVFMTDPDGNLWAIKGMSGR